MALFASCSDDNDPTYLDEIRVSSSYVAIPQTGGNTTIELTTTDSWSIDADAIPSWLTVSPTSGGAGTTTLTFTAANTIDGRTAELAIKCADKKQRINIIQGLSTISNATCAEIIAGPDSKTYRVTGTCTSIANTTYGNWYLTDETGEVYIYGTLDAKGGTKNFLSWGMEVGDIVTVEGPKTTYGTTVELVDVTVVKIEKSLIKVDSLSIEDGTLPLEGGNITAFLTCKGNTGVSLEIPADAQDWLQVVALKNGTSSTVTLRAAPNTGGDRSATVTFRTSDGKKQYSCETTITQKGAILEVTAADFNAAAVSDTQYRVTGVITELYTSDKQGKSFYLADHTGKMLVYRADQFIESGAKVGDVVTVVGKRGEYKSNAQMVDGTFEELKYAVTPISIGDFRNLEDNSNKYYMITGTITEATESGTKNDVTQYGNFNLTDETGSVYIYGVLSGWGGAKGQFGGLNLTWGDQLTIITYKTTYKGLVEASGAVFFSATKAENAE